MKDCTQNHSEGFDATFVTHNPKEAGSLATIKTTTTTMTLLVVLLFMIEHLVSTAAGHKRPQCQSAQLHYFTGTIRVCSAGTELVIHGGGGSRGQRCHCASPTTTTTTTTTTMQSDCFSVAVVVIAMKNVLIRNRMRRQRPMMIWNPSTKKR
jgi:hypothetical protein